MRGDPAIVLRSSPIDAAGQIALVSARSVCYDCERCGEVSERLKELASKASVGGTLPWVQIPPSPPILESMGWSLRKFKSNKSPEVSISRLVAKLLIRRNAEVLPLSVGRKNLDSVFLGSFVGVTSEQ